MGRLALALLLAAVIAAPASARMHAPYRGHRIVPANAAPLDGFTTPSGAYSFRKLRTAYAGPAIRIRRASDNLETDIAFLGCTGFTGCPWDEAAANAHCAATSCFIRTVYDQSGNAGDLIQAAAASQPALIFNCIGSQPCFENSSSTIGLNAAGTVTPATGIVTLNAVANRTLGTGTCAIIRQNGAANHRITGRAAAGGFTLASAVGSIFTILTEGSWHSVVGVINGASSSLTGETGTPGTGSVTGNVTAGAHGISGVASTTCRHTEAIIWDNYILTANETTALIANQRAFWGF